MTEEEESNLDEALEILLLAYIASLSKAALKTQMSASLEAVGELNSVRVKEGLEPVKIPASKLSNESIISASNYEKMLKDKGGSFVVERVENTEKKVFKPWLKDLKENTKIDVLEIENIEDITPIQKRTLLSDLEKKAINIRAKNAAFMETRMQQYEATMRTWRTGEAEYVQRHALHDGATCGICIDLDRRVFKIGDEPPLSHMKCRCYYSVYLPMAGEKVEVYKEPEEELSRDELEKTIKGYENEIKMRSTEKAIVFDKNGKIVIEKEGTATSVKFDGVDIRLFRGNIYTHNHPGGSSLSLSDWEAACIGNMKEMRATTIGKTFSLTKIDGSNFSNSDLVKIRTEYNKHHQDLIVEYRKQIQRNKITRDKAEYLVSHFTSLRTAKSVGGIKYVAIRE